MLGRDKLAGPCIIEELLKLGKTVSNKAANMSEVFPI
jgi:hypothetical protein